MSSLFKIGVNNTSHKKNISKKFLSKIFKIVDNTKIEIVHTANSSLLEKIEMIQKNKIDFFITNYTEMPAKIPENISFRIINNRLYPAEILITHPDSFDRKNTFFVKKNAKIAIHSTHLIAQILSLRPDFKISNTEGNLRQIILNIKNRTIDGVILPSDYVYNTGIDITHLKYYELFPESIIPFPGNGAQIIVYDNQNTKFIQEILTHIEKPETYCANIERDLFHKFPESQRKNLGAYCFKTADFYQLNAVWNPEDIHAPLYLRLRSNDIQNFPDQAYHFFSIAIEKLQKKKIYLTKFPENSTKLKVTFDALGVTSHFVPHFKILNKEIDGKILHTDYAIFTSHFAVESFFESGKKLAERSQIICIGKMTAKALIQYGHEAQFIPNKQTFGGIINWVKKNDPKRHYSWITGQKTPDYFGNQIEKFERIYAYDTQPIIPEKIHLQHLKSATDVIFTSPITVDTVKDLEINWQEKTVYCFDKLSKAKFEEYFAKEAIKLRDPSADEIMSELIKN
jgi:uroporphyrinogen-III synthase/porphobilinogen deaminase